MDMGILIFFIVGGTFISIFINIMYAAECLKNDLSWNPVFPIINAVIIILSIIWMCSAYNKPYIPKVEVVTASVAKGRAFVEVDGRLYNLSEELKTNINEGDEIEVINHNRYANGLYINALLEFKLKEKE